MGEKYLRSQTPQFYVCYLGQLVTQIRFAKGDKGEEAKTI